MDKFLTPLGLKHTGKGQRVTAMHTSNIPFMVLYMHIRFTSKRKGTYIKARS